MGQARVKFSHVENPLHRKTPHWHRDRMRQQTLAALQHAAVHFGNSTPLECLCHGHNAHPDNKVSANFFYFFIFIFKYSELMRFRRGTIMSPPERHGVQGLPS